MQCVDEDQDKLAIKWVVWLMKCVKWQPETVTTDLPATFRQSWQKAHLKAPVKHFVWNLVILDNEEPLL